VADPSEFRSSLLRSLDRAAVPQIVDAREFEQELLSMIDDGLVLREAPGYVITSRGREALRVPRAKTEADQMEQVLERLAATLGPGWEVEGLRHGFWTLASPDHPNVCLEGSWDGGIQVFSGCSRTRSYRVRADGTFNLPAVVRAVREVIERLRHRGLGLS